MDKTLRLLALGLVVLGVAILAQHESLARLTGTNPTGSSADVFCVGKSGAEACVTSAGSVVPTTTNTSALGTSSLVWTTVNATSIIPTDTASSRLHIPSVTSVSSTSLLTSNPYTDGDTFWVYQAGGIRWANCTSTGTTTAAAVVFSSNPTVACRQSP